MYRRNRLTVQELREKLQAYPDDAVVILEVFGHTSPAVVLGASDSKLINSNEFGENLVVISESETDYWKKRKHAN